MFSAAGSLDSFLAYLHQQLGQVYVWGGHGQANLTDAQIIRMDTSRANAQRSIDFINRLKAQGITEYRCFDCSGLISRYLFDLGLVSSKRNCNHLASMCGGASKREDDSLLQPGDLLFRWSTKNKYYHVGVYVGGGKVIESKGRDDGVVLRKLNASNTNYWNRWGRLPYFDTQEDKPMIFEIATPYHRGKPYELMQKALNDGGYPCGKEDGIWGPKSQAALEAAANGGGKLPDSITVTVKVGDKIYTAEVKAG